MSTAGSNRKTVTARGVGIVLNVLALLAVAVASFYPLGEADPQAQAVETDLRALDDPPQNSVDLRSLVTKAAGRRLIRPSQVVAAVKDNGQASKLASKLRLQGVAQFGDALVAYVTRDKEVTSVREGDELYGFRVEKISPSSVILSLDGVLVKLKN